MAEQSSEDYLDRLLAGVTGEEIPETKSNQNENGTGTGSALGTEDRKESPKDTEDSLDALLAEAEKPRKTVAEALSETFKEKEPKEKIPEKETNVKELMEDTLKDIANFSLDSEEETIHKAEVLDKEPEEEADDLLNLLKEAEEETEKPVKGSASVGLLDEDVEEDDIEKMLAAAEASGEAAAKKQLEETENGELSDLIAASESDRELKDLGEALKKSDENVLLDPSIGEIPEHPEEETSEETDEKDGKKKKKGKKDKDKKDKKKKGLFDIFKKKKDNDESEEEQSGEGGSEGEPSNGEGVENAGETSEGGQEEAGKESSKSGEKEKKPGFFQKLLNLLTEEVEDEEPAEASQLKLSDENKAVLEAVDAEGEEAEGGKKGKKGKKEKKEKPPKEKKEKKPKKEKVKKKPEKEETPKGKAVPKKAKIGIFGLAISILVAILLITSYLPNIMILSEGRDAYYSKDYKSAFLAMYGKDLNESDKLLYDKARIIVILQRKIESHDNYLAMSMPYEALDALLQGMAKYETLAPRAEELGITEELMGVRSDILNILASRYGVSEAETMEIIEYAPIDYMGKINSILYGTPFQFKKDEINALYGVGTSGTQNLEVEPTEDTYVPVYEDLLPEEEQYLNEESNHTELDYEENQETENTEASTTPVQVTGAGASVNGEEIQIQIESELFE